MSGDEFVKEMVRRQKLGLMKLLFDTILFISVIFIIARLLAA